MKNLFTLLSTLFLFVCVSQAQAACTAPAIHCNILSWGVPSAPTGVVITGYNIYKASTTHGYVLGTPFKTVTAVGFEDDAVTPGQINFYAVSAKCSGCTNADGTPASEGPVSNEINEKTPTGTPPAPTLTGTSQ